MFPGNSELCPVRSIAPSIQIPKARCFSSLHFKGAVWT